MTTHFHGRHIKVVLNGADPDKMRDPANVSGCLIRLVDKLGMRLMGEPHVYIVEEEVARLGGELFQDEGGITAVAVLSTSHVSVHCWPLRQLAIADVFSCRDFDIGDATGHFVESFGGTPHVTDVSHSMPVENKAVRQ